MIAVLLILAAATAVVSAGALILAMFAAQDGASLRRVGAALAWWTTGCLVAVAVVVLDVHNRIGR